MKYFFSMSRLKGLKLTLSVVIMLFILPPSSCQSTNNELMNSDSYKAFLNDILSPSKQFKRSEDSSCLNKIQNGTPEIQESGYERVIRNLRRNWEMPVDYLQKRGYLTKLDPKRGSQSNDLSMDAYNLINGPLLNPSTFKNVYPLPHGPNSFPSIKTERSDQSNKKYENDVSNSISRTRSSNENLLDCSNPSMNNDLACLDQYLAENWAQSIKNKWKTWFHKNQSTTTTSTDPTTSNDFPITTTSTTTISPSTMSSNIPNQTSEVISDLSIQDAQDRLEFFKIYNDFILAKLASKLSQNEHERRMLNSAQSTEQNKFPVITTSPTESPIVPDFSDISDTDIKVLKELESCLKNKKNLTNLEGDVPVVQSDDTLDVTDDRRVNNTYLPTKLKFLAHLHHDVFDIGHKKSSRKETSKILPNANDCNVDVANINITVK